VPFPAKYKSTCKACMRPIGEGELIEFRQINGKRSACCGSGICAKEAPPESRVKRSPKSTVKFCPNCGHDLQGATA
jgi:hypothetical protein